MKFRTSVLLLCLVVAVAGFLGGFILAHNEGVAAAQGEGPAVTAPPPPGAPPMPTAPGRSNTPMRMPMRSFGPVALSASGNYVYAIYDGKIHQFQAEGLKLVKKVPLDEEPPQ